MDKLTVTFDELTPLFSVAEHAVLGFIGRLVGHNKIVEDVLTAVATFAADEVQHKPMTDVIEAVAADVTSFLGTVQIPGFARVLLGFWITPIVTKVVAYVQKQYEAHFDGDGTPKAQPATAQPTNG